MKIVGIDIGGSHLRVGLADESGEILKLSTERTEGKNVMNQIYNKVESFSSFDGIGIGVAGPIDQKNGTILMTPNVEIRNLTIVEMLKKKFGKPCYLLNDCVASVLGEKAFGVGKEVENLVYITLSTGIGCGVIVDNRVIMGKDGNAHEVGHNTVGLGSKMKCGCGGYGHWEAYCSGKNMPNYTKYLLQSEYLGQETALRDNLEALDSELLFKLANSDRVAAEIVERIGQINAIGIASIINSYDPELITIGGAITLNNEERIINSIKKHVGNYTINRVPRIIATPMKDITIYGALAGFLYMDKLAKSKN